MIKKGKWGWPLWGKYISNQDKFEWSFGHVKTSFDELFGIWRIWMTVFSFFLSISKLESIGTGLVRNRFPRARRKEEE